MKLDGEEHVSTVRAANNYASSLVGLQRFEEAKALMRKTVPVARRVLGENDIITLTMTCFYAQMLYDDPGATLGDLREAVTTLEKMEQISHRVLGAGYPIALRIESCLKESRAALHARIGPRGE